MATKKYYHVRLEDAKGEYSANPSDYWDMPEGRPFKNLMLVGKVCKSGGWCRTEVITRNPTIADLRRHYRRI